MTASKEALSRTAGMTGEESRTIVNKYRGTVEDYLTLNPLQGEFSSLACQPR